MLTTRQALLNIHTLDAEYYEMIASSMAAIDLSPKNLRTSRYCIQKKTPFFVNGERYFEITLQLAGLYATKFNRITVYTKQNILTNYSILLSINNLLQNYIFYGTVNFSIAFFEKYFGNQYFYIDNNYVKCYILTIEHCSIVKHC